MDIERINQRQIDPAISGQNAARRAERASSEYGKGDTQGPRPVASDSVEISSESRELARVRQAVDAAPEVRSERVAGIKKRIEDGTYTVSPELLAKKMMGDG